MKWFEQNPKTTIFLFTLICMFPAFTFGISGSDAAIHGQWTEAFYKLLASGNINPTHAPDLYSGYGSYVFYFYPPLSLYLNSIFYPLFSNPETMNYNVLSASATLACFASGAVCYVWLKSNYSQRTSLVCAVLYMLLPQHLANYYFNSSPAQYWCFAWFPIVMMGIERIIAEKKNGFVLYSFGQALIALTNIPTLIVFSPFAFLYALLISPKLKTLLILTGGALFSFALAAFYLLPMLTLKEYVNISGHWQGEYGFGYERSFLSVSELFNLENYKADSSSIYIQIFNFLILVITVLFLLVFRNLLKEASSRKVFVIIVSSICFAFPVSKFVWEVFPIIQTVQFPFRFLLVSGFFVILLFASYFEKGKNFSILPIIIIPLLAFSHALPLGRGVDSYPEYMNYMYENQIEFYPNYIPYNDNIYQSFHNAKAFDVLPKERLEVSKGAAVWSVVKEEPRNLEIDVSSKKGAELNIRWFYIPGWKAELSGVELDVVEDSKLHTMNVKIPENISDKSLKVYLPLYRWEKLGYLISLLTLLGMAAWHVIRSRSNMKAQD